LMCVSGALDQLDSAFNAVAPSLRPLSPGSMPPPLRLPPPPAAALDSSGNLVIDQPSFLRQNWLKASAGGQLPPVHTAPPPPPPPPMAPPQQFPTIAEPRVLDECPPQPLPPPGAILPTFRVKPFSGEAKPWTPYHLQQAAPPPPQRQQQPAGQPLNRPAAPAKWQPSETPVLVHSHAEVVNLDPEPEPDIVDTTMTWPTPPHGRISVRLDRVEERPPDVEVVPRWALPLRGEYDWREAYQLAEGDEWELTDDGRYCIRKSKYRSSLFTQPPMRRMRICFAVVFFCFFLFFFVHQNYETTVLGNG